MERESIVKSVTRKAAPISEAALRKRRTAQMLGGLRLGLTVGAGLILLALVIAMLASPVGSAALR